MFQRMHRAASAAARGLPQLALRSASFAAHRSLTPPLGTALRASAVLRRASAERRAPRALLSGPPVRPSDVVHSSGDELQCADLAVQVHTGNASALQTLYDMAEDGSPCAMLTLAHIFLHNVSEHVEIDHSTKAVHYIQELSHLHRELGEAPTAWQAGEARAAWNEILAKRKRNAARVRQGLPPEAESEESSMNLEAETGANDRVGEPRRLDEAKFNAGEGLRWLTASVAANYVPALVMLSDLHTQGSLVPQDDGAAFQFASVAADAGHPTAQERVAAMLLDGRAGLRDEQRAVSLLESAAALGSTTALVIHGHHLRASAHGSADTAEKGMQLIRDAAEKEDPDGQFYLAMAHAEQDDMRTALDWARRAADQQHPGALFFLGNAYARGEHMSEGQNYPKALECFEHAAAQGNLDAMCSAGAMYYHGRGTEVNYETALAYYIAAAQHNHVEAIENAADMFENGLGTEKRPDAAALLRRQRDAIFAARQAADDSANTDKP